MRSFSRLEIVLLMDLGAYAGPEFNFVKRSPARADALARFFRAGLIEYNDPNAKWGDGKPDERPWVLTKKGERFSDDILNGRWLHPALI
jgi:hypothetical protein